MPGFFLPWLINWYGVCIFSTDEGMKLFSTYADIKVLQYTKTYTFKILRHKTEIYICFVKLYVSLELVIAQS